MRCRFAPKSGAKRSWKSTSCSAAARTSSGVMEATSRQGESLGDGQAGPSVSWVQPTRPGGGGKNIPAAVELKWDGLWGSRTRLVRGSRILPLAGGEFKSHWPGAEVSRSRSDDRARFSVVMKVAADDEKAGRHSTG